MIDIHCHILPDTDDGAKSWEIAAEMCRMAVADGIVHIVATPHANDEYNYDRARHQATLDNLQSQVNGLRLSLGCDFHFSFENIQDALRNPDRYTIAGTDYLLVELHDYSIPPTTGSLLSQLMSVGLRPILTHPERNSILQRHPQRVLEWAANGCIVQVTANSFTGRWGDRSLKTANFLLQRNAIHVLATDAHDTRSRPPVLSHAREYVRRHTDESIATAMVESNPAAIVTNQPLPWFPLPRT